MFNSFKPTWMVESIYQITPEQLKSKNIKAVLTDLDNTLIAWNNPEATEETIEWIKTMKQNDIKVVILSNNSRKRVKKVATILDL
ncbi:MAG: HAD hydrolase family protein, partial [Alkalibacterium sp.]|nr:HAD hydrolase family protein [Alkalibacterium sp.]